MINKLFRLVIINRKSNMRVRLYAIAVALIAITGFVDGIKLVEDEINSDSAHE